MAGPLARFANSVGADAGRLGARGVLINGELRASQTQGAAPVWFVFSGARPAGLLPQAAHCLLLSSRAPVAGSCSGVIFGWPAP